jgi:hypothetical protein
MFDWQVHFILAPLSHSCCGAYSTLRVATSALLYGDAWHSGHLDHAAWFSCMHLSQAHVTRRLQGVCCHALLYRAVMLTAGCRPTAAAVGWQELTREGQRHA